MSLPKKKLWFLIFLCGLLALFLIMLFCMTLGPASISMGEALKIIIAKVLPLQKPTGIDNYPLSHQVIICQVRMPRVILAALVGAALAAVGTTFQGLFKNPMAGPYIIGISSGSALGATVAIVTGLSSFMGMWALPLAAFCGAVLSTLVVYNIARIGNKVPVYTLLLAGVALSSFMSALMSFIMILNSKELHQIIFWMLGSFSGKDWSHVKIAAPLIVLGITCLWIFSKDLNAMLFGEDTALHLGVDTEMVKKFLLALAAVTIAAAVAVSGTIGFVGLIVPHMVRLIVGPDHRILLPAVSIAGAAFMVAADTFARTAIAPVEIPVGVITAFFGGPFFIYLLKRKKTGVF